VVGVSDRDVDAGEAGGGEADEPRPTGSEPDTGDARSEPTSADGSGAAVEGDGRFGGRTPTDYLKWAGVAVLALTAVVALFGFYTGVSRAITVWVSRSYRPVVNATFNLALLLAALGGIGLLLRRAD
jgi:hypothetical protein